MAVAADILACPNCRATVPFEDWNREHALCAACRAPLEALVFPALFSQAPTGSSGDRILEAGEASCFNHPDKRAVVPCDQCGRFLCSLCRVDFKGQNWCPACIQSWKLKGKLSELDPGRTLYDNMALALAFLPALLIWPTIFTGPATLYLVFRYWRAPSSLLPRTRIRFVLAAVVACLQIGSWLWLGAYALYRL